MFVTSWELYDKAFSFPRVRRYTLEDQKLNFPNDKGLEFIPSLQNKDITWGRG